MCQVREQCNTIEEKRASPHRCKDKRLERESELFVRDRTDMLVGNRTDMLVGNRTGMGAGTNERRGERCTAVTLYSTERVPTYIAAPRWH